LGNTESAKKTGVGNFLHHSLIPPCLRLSIHIQHLHRLDHG